jgi:hypothetical protein
MNIALPDHGIFELIAQASMNFKLVCFMKISGSSLSSYFSLKVSFTADFILILYRVFATDTEAK